MICCHKWEGVIRHRRLMKPITYTFLKYMTAHFSLCSPQTSPEPSFPSVEHMFILPTLCPGLGITGNWITFLQRPALPARFPVTFHPRILCLDKRFTYITYHLLPFFLYHTRLIRYTFICSVFFFEIAVLYKRFLIRLNKQFLQ